MQRWVIRQLYLMVWVGAIAFTGDGVFAYLVSAQVIGWRLYFSK